MPVQGLDHVNIIATDLEASARFYADVLGLTQRTPPGVVEPGQGRWMCDPAGRAIVHLGSAERASNAGREVGAPTAAIHHVAFACTDAEAMLARLERLGIAHRTNDLPDLDFLQIFLTDPSGVVLELNFPR